MKDVSDVEIQDPGCLKRYRTEIPNIVYDLGLTPYELALYCHYKRAAGAGKDGRCTKGRDTLARETGMSAGMISKAKEGLCKPRKEIGNRALISITEQPHERGGKPLQVVSITDIWDANFKQFSTQKAMSPHDIDTVKAMSPHDGAMSYSDGAMSPGDIKKEPVQERTSTRKSTVQLCADAPISTAKSNSEKAAKNGKPKGETIANDDPIYVEVKTACGVTDYSTVPLRKNVADAAKAFRAAGVTPEQVRYVLAQWYEHDWRGQKGNAPTPGQLRDNFESLLNRKDVNHARISNSERKLAASIVY